MLAAALAIAIANTPLAAHYDLFINTPVGIRIGALQIAKPLLPWVNDGLMAVFFFLVGLELEREFVDGELSRRPASGSRITRKLHPCASSVSTLPVPSRDARKAQK